MRTLLFQNRKGFSSIFVDFIMYFCFLLILVLFYLLASIEFGSQNQTLGSLSATDQLQLRFHTVLHTPVKIQDNSIPFLDLLLLVENEPEKYTSYLENTIASSPWFLQETDSVSVYAYTFLIARGDAAREENILYRTSLPEQKLTLLFPSTQKERVQQGALKFFGRTMMEVQSITGETLTLVYDGFCDTCALFKRNN